MVSEKLLTRLSKNKAAALALSKDQRRHKFESEVKMMKALNSLGLNYDWQHPFYSVERFCVVDFYLPEFKLVIEVDGKIHAKRKGYDAKRTEWLYKMGVVKVFRVSNKELLDTAKVAGRIRNVVSYLKLAN